MTLDIEKIKSAALEAALASEQQDYKEVEAMLHAERDDSQTLRDKVTEQAAVIEKLIPAIRFDSLNMSLAEWRDVCKVAEVARTDSKQILADWMREQLGEPHLTLSLGTELFKKPECLK